MRKLTAATFTALAFSAATVAVAPAAQAARHMESWTSTRIVDGKVYVNFADWDGVRPEDVTIRIRRRDSEEVLAKVGIAGARDSDLCAPSGDCEGRSFLSDPVVLPEVREYAVDLVFREGAPDERVGRERGELAYGLDPRLSLTTNYPTDTWEHPLKVIGTVVADDPTTHEAKPMADATVWYGPDRYHNDSWKRTDSGGSFSERPDFGEGTEVSHTYRYENAEAAITVQRRRHDLKLTVDGPATVTAPAGSDIPVRGTVRATSESGVDKPLDGHYVYADEQYKTFTGKDGSFSFMHNVGRNASITVRPSGSGWFNDPPQKGIALRLVPSRFVSLKAAVDKYRKVTVTGKLDVAEGSYPAGATAPLELQYSPDGRAWKSVATFTGRYGQAFSQTPAQRGPAGGTSYWRVRVTQAGQNSPAVKAVRKNTQLINDDLTPEGVKAGTKITAKGTLLQQSGTSWKSFGGQKVRVYFKSSAKGATWQAIASTTTKADGSFSTKVTARRDGTWQIRYTDAPATHYAVYGRQDYVDVR